MYPKINKMKKFSNNLFEGWFVSTIIHCLLLEKVIFMISFILSYLMSVNCNSLIFITSSFENISVKVLKLIKWMYNSKKKQLLPFFTANAKICLSLKLPGGIYSKNEMVYHTKITILLKFPSKTKSEVVTWDFLFLTPSLFLNVFNLSSIYIQLQILSSFPVHNSR